MQEQGLDPVSIFRVSRDLMVTDIQSADPVLQNRVGRSLPEIYEGHPQRQAVLEAFTAALAGLSLTIEVQMDGRWYQSHLNPAYEHGLPVGVIGWAFLIAQPSTPPSAHPTGPLKAVFRCLRPFPLAGAESGDTVVFRPHHRDDDRKCLVQHSTEAHLFVEGLEDGGLEMLGAEPVVGDARRLLLRLLRRPIRTALSLLR